MIVHLQREETENKIHISWLFPYISAYEYSAEMFEEFSERLEEALIKAKETTKVQIVSFDGECCLHVTPMGYIKLMLPWKTYKVIEGQT